MDGDGQRFFRRVFRLFSAGSVDARNYEAAIRNSYEECLRFHKEILALLEIHNAAQLASCNQVLPTKVVNREFSDKWGEESQAEEQAEAQL
jgi:hypothetical protein